MKQIKRYQSLVSFFPFTHPVNEQRQEMPRKLSLSLPFPESLPALLTPNQSLPSEENSKKTKWNPFPYMSQKRCSKSKWCTKVRNTLNDFFGIILEAVILSAKILFGIAFVALTINFVKLIFSVQSKSRKIAAFQFIVNAERLKAEPSIHQLNARDICSETCRFASSLGKQILQAKFILPNLKFSFIRIEMVESIAENLTLKDPHLSSTFDAWLNLITEAKHSLVIAAYKTSLRGLSDALILVCLNKLWKICFCF